MSSRPRLRWLPDGGQPRRTFIEAVMNGKAAWSDFDIWVARWHDAETDVELPEWLGLTPDEYAILGAGTRNLAAVLYARRHDVPLDRAVEWCTEGNVGARGHGEVDDLQELLVREGLVEA